MLRKIRYFIEWLLVSGALWLFLQLGYRRASDLGGGVLRRIGPWLPRSKVARNNLRRAMPELAREQLQQIIAEMWENIGRVIAEFPHVSGMRREELAEVLEIEGLEHVAALKQLGRGSLFFSGHMANWEFSCKALAVHDLPLLLVYRKGNNPWLDRIIQRHRDHYQTDAIPKGRDGARLLLQSVKEHRHVGVLIDQKMNDGIPVPFFGRDAMTSPAIARLALKFNCPIVPAHVERIAGHRQKFIISPPLQITRTGDPERDVLTIMTRVNATLEEWIRKNPAQWIWIHNRWPKADNDKIF
jgi:KDO2-lipid IV(A) lauroyltransferase